MADRVTCWVSGCMTQVPSDPDHVGLCADHIEQLRDDSYMHPVLKKKTLPPNNDVYAAYVASLLL